MVVHSPARRCRGDGGAALVEASLISPIFIFLVLGVFEFGAAFLAYLAVGNTITQTSRAGSIFGSQGNADYQIIQSAKNGSAALNRDQVIRIVVWHAQGPTSKIADDAPGCASGGSSTGTGSPNWTNACNVYTPADFLRPVTQFGCGPSAPDRFWCPTDRKTAATGPNSSDYLGIYFEYEHQWATGLFGDSISFSDQRVVRLEPTSLD